MRPEAGAFVAGLTTGAGAGEPQRKAKMSWGNGPGERERSQKAKKKKNKKKKSRGRRPRPAPLTLSSPPLPIAVRPRSPSLSPSHIAQIPDGGPRPVARSHARTDAGRRRPRPPRRARTAPPPPLPGPAAVSLPVPALPQAPAGRPTRGRPHRLGPVPRRQPVGAGGPHPRAGRPARDDGGGRRAEGRAPGRSALQPERAHGDDRVHDAGKREKEGKRGGECVRWDGDTFFFCLSPGRALAGGRRLGSGAHALRTRL